MKRLMGASFAVRLGVLVGASLLLLGAGFVLMGGRERPRTLLDQAPRAEVGDAEVGDVYRDVTARWTDDLGYPQASDECEAGHWIEVAGIRFWRWGPRGPETTDPAELGVGTDYQGDLTVTEEVTMGRQTYLVAAFTPDDASRPDLEFQTGEPWGMIRCA